jgi:hypothetical protein
MVSGVDSRFDAQAVVKLATQTKRARLELEFSDAAGERHVVSLPLREALAMARLLCDLEERAPYVFGAEENGVPPGK